MKRACTIPGCGKKHYARSWCIAHYQRWKHHGDPLGGGKQVSAKGAPIKFLLETVLAYEGDECLIWPFYRPRGYGSIWLEGRNQSVSRLICEKEHGPPPTPVHQAAHSCGKGNLGCVTRKHLSWKTPAENQADKLEHGTHNRGERHVNSKLTLDAVEAIRRLKGKTPRNELADQFCVHPRTVSAIQRGDYWAWLPMNDDLEVV